MAFARDYSSSRRFYVYYTDQQGFIQIDQFRALGWQPNRADPSSRRSVIRVPHHRGNHKGGQLQVGPTGCSTPASATAAAAATRTRTPRTSAACSARSSASTRAPDGGYSIPADNPFRSRSGARPEVYAYGLRNPYRFSFDRRTGSLTIGDVGQDEIEEIDYVPSRSGRPPAARRLQLRLGRASRAATATRRAARRAHIRPVLQHTHDQGFCSITGGYVIRDRSLGRGWTGRYVYGDYCERHAAARPPAPPERAQRTPRAAVDSLVSFGEDGRGRVYAISLDGPIYRIGRR